MRIFLPLFTVCCLFYSPLSAQYYFTGEVRDPHGDKLQNVSIVVQSTGFLYKTGNEGSFEIVSRKLEDSLSFTIPGYEPYTTQIHSSDFMQVTLKMQRVAPLAQGRLMAAFTGVARAKAFGENPFVDQAATVSFPANINSTSYSIIRRFVDMGTTVPSEAVKIEEMLNYFNLEYEEPEDDGLFHCASQLLPCPWNTGHRLLYLNVCTRKTDREQLPPANLVYLIDASGSMDMPNKLSLIKAALRPVVRNLRDIDRFSLVVYGGRVGVVAAGMPGSKKAEILSAIEAVRPDGPSPASVGLRLAYDVAKEERIDNGANKIILITDGDISNGSASRKDLMDLIAEQSQTGIQLSCLGVGMDTSRNSELPWLAEAGRGNFVSITDAQQAEKVLLSELDRGICTVADSVCISAGFDSTLVKEYRLLGFESRKSALEDTTLKLVGGAVCSGQSLMALFELVPKKDSAGIENIADIKICYTLPGKGSSKQMEYLCPNRLVAFDRAAGNQRKAVCMALFGLKLKESGYASTIPWADVEKMTRRYFSPSNALDRGYLDLVARARKIYEHSKSN
ncbi:MAG: von Willebrand factor type A domain-containing protein [Bacteroidetes bacterium]|nr:von Willebrand factor type A domain-containing protein [Bacteroidota bacterium]